MQKYVPLPLAYCSLNLRMTSRFFSDAVVASFRAGDGRSGEGGGGGRGQRDGRKIDPTIHTATACYHSSREGNTCADDARDRRAGIASPAPREGIARGDARRYGAGDRRTLGADFHDAAVRAAAREARRRGRHRQPNPAVRRARRQRRGGSRQRRGPRERGLHRARGGASRRRTREYRATCERRGAFEKERRRRRRRARGSSARTRQHRVRSRHVFARPCRAVDRPDE